MKGLACLPGKVGTLTGAGKGSIACCPVLEREEKHVALQRIGARARCGSSAMHILHILQS